MNPVSYHASDAIGSTDLRHLLRSPAHFRAYRDGAREETAAMRLGTAVHCAVLEPERWQSAYAAAPDVDRRTKDGKAAWAAFCEAHDGKTVLSADEYATAERIAASVREHPAAALLLRSATAIEAPVFWADATTGVKCKGRLDLVAEVNGRVVIADLKTTRDASPSGFPREIAHWQLHVQAAHYVEGWQAVHGVEVGAYVLIAVESETGFVCAHTLGAMTLGKGAEMRLKALDLYCECVANNRWPAYPDDFVVSELPAWAA